MLRGKNVDNVGELGCDPKEHDCSESTCALVPDEVFLCQSVEQCNLEN